MVQQTTTGARFQLATAATTQPHRPSLHIHLAGRPAGDRRRRIRMAGIQRGDPLVVGRVIGDVVDPFVRRVALRVGYASRDEANGCELRPAAIADQPRVEVGGPDMRTFYTLVSSLPTLMRARRTSVRRPAQANQAASHPP